MYLSVYLFVCETAEDLPDAGLTALLGERLSFGYAAYPPELSGCGNEFCAAAGCNGIPDGSLSAKENGETRHAFVCRVRDSVNARRRERGFCAVLLTPDAAAAALEMQSLPETGYAEVLD